MAVRFKNTNSTFFFFLPMKYQDYTLTQVGHLSTKNYPVNKAPSVLMVENQFLGKPGKSYRKNLWKLNSFVASFNSF